ncbi:haloalkane dehalogenase [Shimia isoporae]|uniref:Haloalkane dehalogenase n=1 Tax=Shimia isoporae TaxID=647720 RepID=A0A4R1NIN9_9RHOB|nr:haloalkane dehalogenase [Shimia isoporae]TCL08106.1 haloalkane dehalogenase [Shimia isoporae]
MKSPQAISAEFPFESRFVDVNGSRIHYVDEGEGDPVLFIHGNPTSSYLWRNIIPHTVPHGRAIALDLIGMGKSDKPDLGYRFADHVPYLDGFIEALGLKNITLVIHDWGSALGFHYAHRHPDNIRGIAFMEGVIRPMTWSGFPPDFRTGFKMMRTTGLGWLMISGANVFVNKILPSAIVRDLSAEEMVHYRAPYPTAKSRKPVRVWPTEIPIDGSPSDVHDIVAAYSAWLGETDVPMLLFFGSPGGTIRADGVQWCRDTIRNLRVVDVGAGIHFIQEDNPHLIGRELANWLQELVPAKSA